MYQIQTPYLLFLGDAPDQLAAKTARGINDWRPEKVVGQMSLENCKADLGLPELGLQEAYDKGARTLVLGTANRGGVISAVWMDVLKEALHIGYDIANGLHNKVNDIVDVAGLATQLDKNIYDVRHPTEQFPIGTGEKRSGKRLLPVGTDCSCGKMYTSLALEKEMLSRGMNATFRATGQTGILVSGSGASIDAVVADFMAGAVETIAPANEDPNHWDIIEGQGSLAHPSYSGVTMALIHGGQPDAMVLCHEPTRSHMRGLPHQKVPAIKEVLSLATTLAQIVNNDAKFIGICVNTSQMVARDIEGYLKKLEDEHGLPACDPYSQGTAKIVDMVS
ncbi:DUF1611 domain-containing protein [Temperatibacter marinus]|uniref:DUF1611 domain-containing protein n=1 Tax=Temperatibacter marinus TaxID=1456591 RepID=A0AA52EFB4_9PROT|nr:N-acetyltransferase DgcN [Temperatibacter marinus]WND01489.1 DUF1611 domain-containing protein [Temperatibacter marinus]